MRRYSDLVITLLVTILLLFTAFTVLPSSSAGNDGLADSPWPCYGHDRRNTGRSPYDTSHVDGTEKWSFSINQIIRSSPVIANDGTIYFGFSYYDSGKLLALNQDGTKKWGFETGGYIKSTPAIDDDGTIYIGSESNLYAIKPDGTKKWVYETKGWIRSSPTIAEDGTIYVRSGGVHLNAINPDGSKRWNFTRSVESDSGYSMPSINMGIYQISPAIDSKGTIYTFLGSKEKGSLYAINPNGTEKWNFDPVSPIPSSPTIGSSTIFVRTFNNTLYALNLDGNVKWSFNQAPHTPYSPTIGKDGTVYVSGGGILYALDPDGTEKWRFRKDISINTSPTIGSDGTIYVGTSSGLYGINSEGKEDFNFTTNSSSNFAPAIGRDGTVFTLSNKKLYAIGGPPNWQGLAIATSLLAIFAAVVVWKKKRETSPDS